MKTTTILVSIAFMAAFAQAGAAPSSGEGIEFIHDKKFQDILNMAKAQNKLVFMDCYTSWCGPCKRLSSTVFPDSSVGEFFNSTFVNAKFDMEKDEGVTIATKYGVRAYPTLLWLDGDGKEVHKVVGALDVPGLLQNGKKAVDPTPGILTGMRKEFTDGLRSVTFLCDYVNTLHAADEKYDDVFKIYLDKLAPADFTDSKHAKTIFNLTNDLKSPGLPYLVKNKEYYEHLMGVDVYNNKINQIAAKAVAEAPRFEDRGLFDGALQLIKANKAPDHAEKTLKFSMDYYSGIGDWNNYEKNASQYVKKYAPKDAVILNDIAWQFFLNIHDESALEKASKWAYEALNIDNKYTYNLTYAYLLYKLKNYKEAEKACDYAIIRAKEEKTTPSSATALKDAIAKSIAKPN
jgi:thiol-disulfide isomerase/thioredoxin